MHDSSERGAAAVEFAILLPLLVMLVMGIIEFGRAYNAQISLTSAARESVRVMAISNNPASAKTAAVNAAVSLRPALRPTDVAITTNGPSAGLCVTGATATVTLNYSLSTMTGIAGPFTLTAKGVMQCGG
ncbi:pilus assembly protein [Arthrobacter sp. FW305-BF8]|uniref:TadE/TadG family type IV pilus assembly protein n=1 Tax=Arthrobacter sp. FW305-BF8 TaxID=2879617 RepID=UPI001F3B47D8|nr:TadE family protein [Arthrobacter sp. FW305-BF8]UKA53165.1 pilus assembly protein [Arthrobacter sp. FW305-BF8]